MIRFNVPYKASRELQHVKEVLESGNLSGDGLFTRKVHAFFSEKYGFRSPLLTTSGTHALEMAAILARIAPGDEVIMPSYTFVSTANAFELRGAKIVFADSLSYDPNMDTESLENLITPKTKAIVVVHYAGVAVHMDQVMQLAQDHDLTIIEDAAHSIDATYKGRPLGTFGSYAAFSFHETKNISCGEGGMFIASLDGDFERAEIIREKGTNRSAFFRGDIDKYGWVDVGSSYLPSDILAAVLYAQLEELDQIQTLRLAVWKRYMDGLSGIKSKGVDLPVIPDYASNNAHMFYIVCNDKTERTELIERLKEHQIKAAFHYQPLHRSKYFAGKHDGRSLPNADKYGDRLVRLPLFADLNAVDQDKIIDLVCDHYK